MIPIVVSYVIVECKDKDEYFVVRDIDGEIYKQSAMNFSSVKEAQEFIEKDKEMLSEVAANIPGITMLEESKKPDNEIKIDVCLN